jgi:uncharacterized protein YkwD
MGFVIAISLLATLRSANASLTAAAPAPAPAVVAYRERTSDAEALLQDINAHRIGQGLAPLTLDQRLCAIAREHALDMASRSYFGHNSPEGESPFERMDRAHYGYGYAGENLALDQSVDEAAAALWHSPEHRENILEPHYARLGVAAVVAPEGEIFVEDFSD